MGVSKKEKSNEPFEELCDVLNDEWGKIGIRFFNHTVVPENTKDELMEEVDDE